VTQETGLDLLITSDKDVIKDFKPGEDHLDFDSQPYIVTDSTVGIVFKLPNGTVTLEGVHTLPPTTSDWLIP
jgi:hypothetical protein